MLIDTHAHLNFKAFDKDLNDIINRAKKAGVEKIIIPGAKIDSSQKAIAISQKYDDCFAAVGIHPHHADEYTSLIYSDEVNNLENLAKEEKVVAIGEIGLDYHEYKGYPPLTDETKKNQKELLILQIEIAKENNLPVIFHCRDAFNDQLDIIRNEQITGVYHCFGGEKKHLRKVLNMGFYVGFDGNITYPENKNLQESVKFTPLDRLLFETDSPYLTPFPFRGKRNEPAYLSYTANFIAQIHKISEDKIEEYAAKNALKLFQKISTRVVKYKYA